jgi:3-deoxy-D-manno-octulosonic-acid transferase
MLAGRLNARIAHQFVPLDHPGAVDRFLDHWQPDVALWVESEFWPNLITQTAERKVPMVLVNARFSERSASGWARARSTIARVLSSFELALAVDEPTAARLRALGANRVEAIGNLKWASPPLPADAAALQALQDGLGTRPRWLAASTHEGEERIAGEVHRKLTDRFPDLVTLIAPRHPERGPAIAEALEELGLKAGLRSAGAVPGDAPIYVADTIGEMGLFYRLAPLAFVGGSLVPHGGQNPLEGARLGSALLHGPHTENFAELYEALDTRGGARLVEDADSFAKTLFELLSNEDAQSVLREEAKSFAAEGARLLDRVADALEPYLDRGRAGAGGEGGL